MGRRPKWQLTEERRQALLERYGRGETAWELLGLPVFRPLPGEPPLRQKTLYEWAYRLGLSGDAPPRWSANDDMHVEDHYGKKPTGWIARHLKRSDRAVEERAHKLNLEQAYYTVSDLAANLGIGQEQVRRWESQREHKLRASAGPHRFTREDLGNFFLSNEMEWYRVVRNSQLRHLLIAEWIKAVRDPRMRRSPAPRPAPKGKAS